jgi:hypothetical protein
MIDHPGRAPPAETSCRPASFREAPRMARALERKTPPGGNQRVSIFFGNTLLSRHEVTAMFTLSGHHSFVTTSSVLATPSTGVDSTSSGAPALAPGAFLIMIVVVILLGWSFRVLGRTLPDLVGMLKMLANVALTAVLLVGTLAVVIAWMFFTASQT